MGYTQTRTRVDFGALNPALNVSQVVRDPSQPVDPNSPAQPNAYGSGGNPDLVPLTSNNYDVSAEYYFSSTGSVTIAGFYRDLFGFTSNYTRRVQDPIYGLIEINRPENAGAGKIKGFEINAQTFLDFPPRGLRRASASRAMSPISTARTSSPRPSAATRRTSASPACRSGPTTPPCSTSVTG
ncbi:TonB-dependent receptor domain-containing protein [Caulobacter segnis]